MDWLFSFFVLVLPWYIAVHIATDGGFTSSFFGLHNFSRYTSVVSGHRGSLFYFIPVIFIGFLPWTFFLPQAIYSVVKNRLNVETHHGVSLQKEEKDLINWFCLWWFLVIFLFFSFSKTKLLTYILSLFPAISILVAFYFEKMFYPDLYNKKSLVIGFGIFFLFCLAMICFCMFNLNLLLPQEVKGLKLNLIFVFISFLMLVGVSMGWASSSRDGKSAFIILLSTFFLVYFWLISFFLPKFDKHSSALLKSFAKNASNDVEIAVYQGVKPSLNFYSKRKIEKIDSVNGLQKKLNQENKFAFVAKKKIFKNIQLDNAYLWSSDSRFVIYANFP